MQRVIQPIVRDASKLEMDESTVRDDASPLDSPLLGLSAGD